MKKEISAVGKNFPECLYFICSNSTLVVPGGSVVKNPSASAGDASSVLGLGRSPRDGNGNPLQYPCLENPRDTGAWWAAVHGVAKNQT